MEKRDFTLKNINRNLEEQLRDSDLNFCKMLVQAYDEDLSVTAQYDPPEEFVSLGRGETGDADLYYYGVSPCLDGRELVRCISGLAWQTCDGLSGYLEEHGQWFMVRPQQGEYLPALARYIVVCMASHYGVRIAMNRAQYDRLQAVLAGQGYAPAEIQTIIPYQEHWGTEPFAVVKGCPTRELVAYLEGYRYRRTAISPRANQAEREVEAWTLVETDDGVPQGDTRSLREV